MDEVVPDGRELAVTHPSPDERSIGARFRVQDLGISIQERDHLVPPVRHEERDLDRGPRQLDGDAFQERLRSLTGESRDGHGIGEPPSRTLPAHLGEHVHLVECEDFGDRSRSDLAQDAPNRFDLVFDIG